MDEKIIEAMARAMYESRGGVLRPKQDHASPLPGYDKLDIRLKDYLRAHARAAWDAAKATLAGAGTAQMEPSASTRFAKHVKANHPGGHNFEIKMVAIQSIAARRAIEEAYRDGFIAGIAVAPDQRSEADIIADLLHKAEKK